MMIQTKNKYNNALYAVILFCIIEAVLMVGDIWSSINHNLLIYGSQQEQLISTMLSSYLLIDRDHEGSIKDTIISNIKEDFPTSSSVYCFVALNDKMIYIKDQSTTQELLNKNEISVERYLNQKGKKTVILDNPAKKTIQVVMDDNIKYYVSMDTISYRGDVITLGICTKVNYIIKKYSFDILVLHLGTYFALFVIGFISTAYFFYKRVKQDKLDIEELKNELSNNRLLMDKLNEEVWEVTSSEMSNNLYGFFPKGVVQNVLSNLTIEQSKLTLKIFIHINSPGKEIFINIAALLERFYIIKNISCFWNEEEFLVLLLNATNKDAVLFEKFVRRQYRTKYNKNIDDVIFDIEPIETCEVRGNAI